MFDKLGLFGRLCEKFLPFYWQLWPNYWLAIWSAPVLSYGGTWRGKDWKSETHWQALRITLRKGKLGSELWKTVKRGII